MVTATRSGSDFARPTRARSDATATATATATDTSTRRPARHQRSSSTASSSRSTGFSDSDAAGSRPCDDAGSQPTLSRIPIYKSSKYEYSDDIDPTLEFFYRPHTITFMLCLLGWFLYAAFYRTQDDPVRNNKTAVAAIVTTVIIFGLTQFKDGPFIRPHPALWRVVLALSLCYQAFLSFLIFQDIHSARRLFSTIDPECGHPPIEKSYADNCDLSFANVVSQMDAFVLAHILGWFGKAIIIRDYWACWVLSILFEMCEYSLEHHLENFKECWWDHWIVDVMICNWLGTYLGMKTCQYFEMRQYSWRGIHEYTTYRGKFKRVAQQFTPHSWTKFEWGGTRSFRNYISVVTILFHFLANELCAFYLKHLLWIPPTHWLNTVRVCFFALVAVCSTREVYQYFTDPHCKRFGPQAWLNVTCIMTEILLVIKFGKGQFPKPFPLWVKVFWGTLLLLVVAYPIYKFCSGHWDKWGEEKRVVEKAKAESAE